MIQTGHLRTASLGEVSGVTPSVLHPGVLWTFNDSGNDAKLFAIDSTGASLGVVRVTGSGNRDWEAIASGPCDEGSCLYIGDVGDNQASRPTVRILRVAEPQPGDDTTHAAVALAFQYPDAAHDVEAMWVSPDTSTWLVTKRPMRGTAKSFRPALLFRIPPSAWRAAAPVQAELVDSLALTPNRSSDTWITDAAFTMREGRGHVAVRTYQELLVLSADSWSGRPTRVEARCSLRPLNEEKGEAVTWLAGGRLLFLNEGRFSRLATGRCEP